MKIYYDLHIHSALSPCGDNDMTPNNIVNMSLLKGLEAIAITDHNSCGNVEAVSKVAQDRILVIPGMEVTTSEEIHTLCYFPDIESAKDMEAFIKKHLPVIENRPDIFGFQYYMDENDEVLEEEKTLLVTATDLSIYDIQKNTLSRGGIMVPAHIDRSSYSIISNLGAIPPDIDFSTVEITEKNRDVLYETYEYYNIITSSDAHYLENISEAKYYLEVLHKNKGEIFKYLCSKKKDNFKKL